MNQWLIRKEAFKEFLAIIGGLMGAIFVFVSSLAILSYFIALGEKIRRPSFKNLDTGGFVMLGFVVLGLGVCIYLILQKLFGRIK
jgi:hypothetical protein